MEVNGIVYAGCAEIVRIVTGAETNATFAFTLNGGVHFTVDITPNNPLDITCSGITPQLKLDETMTVTASTPLQDGNVVFIWYLDGAVTGTEATVHITPTTPGTHTLNVTGFTADGTRAGSATHKFLVGYKIDKVIHTITAIAGEHGSIPPTGNVEVIRNTDISFEIKAADSYRINGIRIDKDLLKNVHGLPTYSYTFSNVTSEHIIEVYFYQHLYSLTVEFDGPGSTNPSGTISIPADIPYGISADPDPTRSTFSSWSVITGNASITDPNSQSTTVALNNGDATIHAHYKQYTVTWYAHDIPLISEPGIIGYSFTINTAPSYQCDQNKTAYFQYWSVSGEGGVTIASPYLFATTVTVTRLGNVTIGPVYNCY